MEEQEAVAPPKKNPDSTEQGHPAREEVIWEVRIAKLVVSLVFAVVTGGSVIAIFVSAYKGATTPPKVWKIDSRTRKAKSQMKPSQIRACVRRLQGLDREQYRETTALWYRMRHGQRGHLTLWQEWSHDWRKRLKKLQQQCPMALHKGDSQTAFAAPLLPLPKCIQRFGKLYASLKKKSSKLWSHARKGPKKDLRRWQTWSHDWQRRMQLLIEHCPLSGKGEIAKSFHRASQKMLELQRQQEKAVLPFFSKTSDLFRDIRQSMHSLKEELR